jgi:hypothetical protein
MAECLLGHPICPGKTAVDQVRLALGNGPAKGLHGAREKGTQSGALWSGQGALHRFGRVPYALPRVRAWGFAGSFQLERILTLVGSPSEEELSWLPDDVTRRHVQRLQQRPRTNFQHLFSKAQRDAVDVLEQILQV